VVSLDGLAVETRGLRRDFRVGRSVRAALRGVDLDVRRGEFVVVYGRSGAGKTTLLNLVAGLDRPTEGRVAVEGRELAELDEDDLSELRRERIGFVFQTFGLIPLLTAAENVEVPLRLRRAEPEARAARVRELLDRVGLLPRAAHLPSQLSGGEQQRVAIARALANEPRLVLADEPTAQLDSGNARAIVALLRGLVGESGATALVTTHDPIVLEAADRVVRLEDGLVSLDGQPLGEA
jgi:putative ABC transport system ATP-binding protein